MKTKILIITLFFLVCGFATVSFSYDHVRYVDYTNGDDVSNNGMSAGSGGAWKNLFFAVNEIYNNIPAAESVILYVAPGTYPADMAVAGMNNITIIKSDFTIMGAEAATTILDGTNADTAYWQDGIIIDGSAVNVTISDMTIRYFDNYSGIRTASGSGVVIYNCDIIGGTGSTHGIYVDGASATDISPDIYGNVISSFTNGIYLNAATALGTVSPNIKGNTISQNSSAGIYIYTITGEAHPVISENTIFSNMDGIYVSASGGASSPQVFSNRIFDLQTGNGIEFDGGAMATSQPEIINNIIYQGTGSMVNGISINAVATGSVINAKILHNTIDGGTDNGIYSEGGSGTVTAEVKYNNITNFTGGGSSYGIFNGSNSTLTIDYVNVWNNATGDYLNCSATNSISADPQYAADYSIPTTSPCVDAVAAAAGDPVDYDIIGTSRPRQKDNVSTPLHDIGAYEYPYQEYDFTMPGGTGVVTDYRILTLPVQLAESSLSTVLTTAYGAYDDEKWRAFVWDGSAYTELGSTAFDTATYNSLLSSHAGRAFWVISLDGAFVNDTITFEGTLTGNKHPLAIPLVTGWNMIALPWPASTANPSIEIGNLVVKDENNKYWLTSANNNLTELAVWEYTAAGSYTKLETSTDLMVPGKGYWIKVNTANPVEIAIPPDNGVYMTAAKRITQKSKSSSEQPPPPPGSNISASGDNGCFIKTCLK